MQLCSPVVAWCTAHHTPEFQHSVCEDLSVSLGDKMEDCGLDVNRLDGLAGQVHCEPTGGAARRLLQSRTAFIEAQSPEEGDDGVSPCAQPAQTTSGSSPFILGATLEQDVDK